MNNFAPLTTSINIDSKLWDQLVNEVQVESSFLNVTWSLLTHLTNYDKWVNFRLVLASSFSFLGTCGRVLDISRVARLEHDPQIRLETRLFWQILQGKKEYKALAMQLFKGTADTQMFVVDSGGETSRVYQDRSQGNSNIFFVTPEAEKAMKSTSKDGLSKIAKVDEIPIGNSLGTTYKIVNDDAVKVALELQRYMKRSVLVADWANEWHVCGGFNNPLLGTQEEKMAEKTLLYPYLDPRQNQIFGRQLAWTQNPLYVRKKIEEGETVYEYLPLISGLVKTSKENPYANLSDSPLKSLNVDPNQDFNVPSRPARHIPVNGCIYLPSVPVIRDDERAFFAGKSGENVDSLETLCIGAIAAIDMRKDNQRERYEDKDNPGRFNEAGITLTKQKMRAFLSSGLANGNHNIVVGAMGCGAFKNNPEQIVNCWQEVFEEKAFKNRFQNIYFAIKDAPDSPNIKAFTKGFSEVV